MSNNPSSPWQTYIIPDLKTWSTNAPNPSRIEYYDEPEDAFRRFKELRPQPCNHEPNDLTPNGEPYARLTMGIERKDGRNAADILQVRGGKNALMDDFTRDHRIYEDAAALQIISQAGEEIGFDCVKAYAQDEHGGYVASEIIPFQEWNSSFLVDVAPPSYFAQMENRFQNGGDAYALYQLKHGDGLRDLRFEPSKRAQGAIDKANYQIVYTGALPQIADKNVLLEQLYQQFNIDHPSDFRGHSLSMSDVIALKQNGVVSAHYVDTFGFVELPGFYSGKNPLRSLEDAVEQNDNQLDGIINNTPPEKPSLMQMIQAEKDALRDQPKHHKTAPSKGTELEQ